MIQCLKIGTLEFDWKLEIVKLEIIFTYQHYSEFAQFLI